MLYVKLSVLVAATLVFSGAPAALAETSSYVLGPQDRLGIRVHTLRRSVGDTFEWSALSSEFSIGADGTLSLPILGQVEAAGSTASELADVIGRTLQERAGLSDLPSASVEVVRYRPFYVLGAVQQPGQYDFQPGLTVLQALSIARGLVRAEDVSSAEREKVTAGGDLRVLDAERFALQARSARLSAEAAEAEDVTFPPELSGSREPAVIEAIRQETQRFVVGRKALADELDAVRASKVLLENELTVLDDKGEALERQLKASEDELKVVRGLVRQGLAVTPRQLAAEASQALLNGNRLDVQVAVLRAQQSLAQANRSLVDLPARRREQAIADGVTTREALNTNTERLGTARQLLENAAARSVGLGAKADTIVEYSITRDDGAGPVSAAANENAQLRPGDVLQVTLTPALPTPDNRRVDLRPYPAR